MDMTRKAPRKQNQEPLLVGLLALQGAFDAHRSVCESLGVKCAEVRTEEDLAPCTHLIIPGGESTTFLRLIEFHNLFLPLEQFARSGKPVLGTCAGVVLLAREVSGPNQMSLGLLDISVERNAYGSQVNSFETDLSIPLLGPRQFRGVFIRAPMIKSVGKGVTVLASLKNRAVFVREGNVWGTTFHPELSGDNRIHAKFLESF